MWKNLVFFTIFTNVNCYLSITKLLEVVEFSGSDFVFDYTLPNTTELIKKEGYTVEEYKVITEDGYILTIHRIPCGKESEKLNKIPVLLMHGFLSSSANWIKNGHGNSLGYMLADAGYDVWLGNTRGNYYSRKHVTLDPDKDEDFWNFSWNEIGYYDLPAMIAQILETTGRKKLHYLGYSQGTTSFFVMGSERPEFNEKISLMQGFAPAVFMSHSKNVLLNIFAPHANSIEELLKLFGISEPMPNLKMKKIVTKTCSEDSIFMPICLKFLSVLLGLEPTQLNATMIPVYLNSLAGLSIKQIVHFAQFYNTGIFRKLDFGVWENFEVYKTINPPEYDLEKVTAPIALYYGENDKFVNPVDVMIFYEKIKNPVGIFKISETEFSHLDSTWSMNSSTLVYEPVLNLMKQFNDDDDMMS